MGAGEVVTIVLAVVSLFATILGGLGSWGLLKAISNGEEIARLKAQIEDGDRRFGELKESIDRLHGEIGSLQSLLQEVKNQIPKRATDTQDWRGG